MANVLCEETPVVLPAFDDWTELFAMLSDRTRLRILFHLSQTAELHVGALCELLAQPQPAVSHHLSRLRSAGVIAARRDGKQRHYRLLPGPACAVLRTIQSEDAAT